MCVCVCLLVRAAGSTELSKAQSLPCPSLTPQWGGSPRPWRACRWVAAGGSKGCGSYASNPSGLSSCLGLSRCEGLQRGDPSRRASRGYTPACRAEDGGFSPVQCDRSIYRLCNYVGSSFWSKEPKSTLCHPHAFLINNMKLTGI